MPDNVRKQLSTYDHFGHIEPYLETTQSVDT